MMSALPLRPLLERGPGSTTTHRCVLSARSAAAIKRLVDDIGRQNSRDAARRAHSGIPTIRNASAYR